jgi:xylulokinase
MLPGDFIAMKMTGEETITMSALSEGIFWDFRQHGLSKDITSYFGFDASLFPSIQPVFSAHGMVKESVASRLGLRAGIPVTYKAGDQLNNALALNVLRPGEVAATAGTSGVIYGVSDQLEFDLQSRINSFAHVNHQQFQNRIGVLLCINGAGIFNRWIKNMFGAQHSYDSLNLAAKEIAPGADGLISIPFGNGAERMLNNMIVGAQLHHLDFNIHSLGHLVRSAQEGIAFAFRYGLDIMKENGISPSVIRAGKANLFLSEIFTTSFVNATGVAVELHQCDGSVGAAVGAGLGVGAFTESDLSKGNNTIAVIEPGHTDRYEELYQQWKEALDQQMESLNKMNTLLNA